MISSVSIEPSLGVFRVCVEQATSPASEKKKGGAKEREGRSARRPSHCCCDYRPGIAVVTPSCLSFFPLPSLQTSMMGINEEGALRCSLLPFILFAPNTFFSCSCVCFSFSLSPSLSPPFSLCFSTVRSLRFFLFSVSVYAASPSHCNLYVIKPAGERERVHEEVW